MTRGRRPKITNWKGVPWREFICDEILLQKTHDWEEDPGAFERLQPLLAAYAVRKLPASKQFDQFYDYVEMIENSLNSAVDYAEDVRGVIVYLAPRIDPEDSTILQISTTDPHYKDARERAFSAASKRVIRYSKQMLNTERYPGVEKETRNQVYRTLISMLHIAAKCGASELSLRRWKWKIHKYYSKEEADIMFEEINEVEKAARDLRAKANQEADLVRKIRDNL